LRNSDVAALETLWLYILIDVPPVGELVEVAILQRDFLLNGAAILSSYCDRPVPTLEELVTRSPAE
jgi:hypothetical protein